ncbi:MAG TPA: DUF2934 domain-containing protein [Nitrospira sp.]|jgi:hypothetical protein|nr:DUF2934 domain-containing protein [Nitrospira sp.]
MATRKTTIRKVKGRLATDAGSAKKAIELPEEIRERISRKAYELWEQRGRRDGNALGDWLDAEKLVMEQIHEA